MSERVLPREHGEAREVFRGALVGLRQKTMGAGYLIGALADLETLGPRPRESSAVHFRRLTRYAALARDASDPSGVERGYFEYHVDHYRRRARETI